MNKKQITEKLAAVGSAWAMRSDKFVDTNDGYDARPTYHIHPDASYPHQAQIKRFNNLAQVKGYAKAREAAQNAADDSAAYEIMEDFWDSLQ